MRRLSIVVALLAAVVLALPATAGAQATATYQYQWNASPQLDSRVTGEVAIDAGSRDSVAIEPDGSVVEFGIHGKPVVVPHLSDIVAVADGKEDYIAISSPSPLILDGSCPDSTVWRWDKGGAATEVTELDGLGVTEIAEAAGHQFALTCTGKVYVWGNNDLALGSYVSETSPTLNPSLTALTDGTDVGVLIDAGSVTGGILVDGQAYMWGANKDDQCGCGSSASQIEYPTAVRQSVPFTFIDTGGYDVNDDQTLALDAAGDVWCWGTNLQGQCGLGTTTNVPVPTEVPGIPPMVTVRAGGSYSLFLDTSGNVWQSGNNATSPTEVLSGMTMVSAGAFHAVAAN
jgi:hypothetical protein